MVGKPEVGSPTARLRLSCGIERRAAVGAKVQIAFGLLHFRRRVVLRDPVFDFAVKLRGLDSNLLRFRLRRNIGEGVIDRTSLSPTGLKVVGRSCVRVCPPRHQKTKPRIGDQTPVMETSLSSCSEPDKILASALLGGGQIDVSKNECDSAAYSYRCCGPHLPLAAPDSAT
jgi:hypothetical protein